MDVPVFRGHAYQSNGQYDKAISDFYKTIEINPRHAKVYKCQAWILATCPTAIYRNGTKAIVLAKKAVELNRNAMVLDTLAAACAEAGRFEIAISTQEEAIEMLKKEDKKRKLIEEYTRRLNFYKNHKPWREK